MGSFSKSMRNTATALIDKFGSDCVLTKPLGVGVYDPSTGDTTTINTTFTVKYAPKSQVNIDFGQDGKNTNLDAFDTSGVTIAWFGEEVDTTWLFNGSKISKVRPTEAQNDIIVYDLIVDRVT